MEIVLLKQAQKNILELDSIMRDRIRTAIYKLPAGDIKKLKGYRNMYRLRTGDYRVLYETAESQIIIHSVLPRDKAYKKIREAKS